MPHLPLKQFNPRSLSASSVSSFFPQFAGLTGASLFTGLFRIKGTNKETYGPRTRRCRTGLMPGAEMSHLPLKQFNPRSLSASSVSSSHP